MKFTKFVESLVLCLLFVAGCKPSPNINHESGAHQSSSIEELARLEGTVNIWATNAEDLNWIPNAFAKDHPGISVEIFTDLNVASRVITEDRAGRHNVDVIWNSEALVQPLIERNLLAKDEWGSLGLPPEDVGAEGHMAITSSVVYAVAYRTDLVKTADVPQSWMELADPKFRGRMAASPLLFARMCAALAAVESAPQWLEYAKTMRSQSQTLWSNDLLEFAIVSGERPYVVGTADYLAERWKARGLPIEVVLPEPVFVTQFGSVVMRNAPHPSAARLLAMWLASPSGRAARETALLAVDLRPSSTHPKAEALREAGLRLHIDNKQAIDARNRIIPEMDSIFTGPK